MKKRSVLIAGHSTSVSLEEEFWEALKELAQLEGRSLNAVIEEVDAGRSGNLSSALRVFVLNALRGDQAQRRSTPPPRSLLAPLAKKPKSRDG